MQFYFRASKNGRGGLEFGQRERAHFLSYLKANPDMLFQVTPVLPESNKHRRFYRGAGLPLWCYLDGKDYRNKQLLDDLHDLAKLEFNSREIFVEGKSYKVARSTKGKDLTPYLERVIGHLVDNYGIDPTEVLDPKKYRDLIDTVSMKGNYETYIDYLIADGRLRSPRNAA